MAFSDTKERETLVFTGIMLCLLSMMMYRRNRWAWLIAVIIQVNPIGWIVNGIYLKNRWAEMRDKKETTDPGGTGMD